MELTTTQVDSILAEKPNETYGERCVRIKKMFIPEISRQTLEDRASRIKPVVTFLEGGGRHARYFIKEVCLHSVAYTWNPVKADKAENLEVLGQIITYHSWGHPMYFKPSVAEVLAQIPENFLDKVTAFEIVGSPEDADDLNRYTEITNAGFHMAITQLYRRSIVPGMFLRTSLFLKRN